MVQSYHTVPIGCFGGIVCCLCLVGLAVFREKASYLVAIHHEVVGGDQGFEHHHPARVGRPLKQRVRQMGDVNVHVVGAVDEIWRDEIEEKVTKWSHNMKKKITFFEFAAVTKEH